MNRREEELLTELDMFPYDRTRCGHGCQCCGLGEEPESSVVEVTHFDKRWLLDVERVVALDMNSHRLAFETVYWSDLSEEDFWKVKDLWIKLKKRK